MPLYDYLCSTCGDVFDARRSPEDPPPACPSCGAGEVRRKLSLFAATGPRGAAGPAAGGGCACGGACACAR